jgi:hypothetical protein
MALPTAQDNINAMMYALDRLKKERCLVAAEQPNSGIQYESNDTHRMYPCHVGLQNCEHGHCKIATKNKCDSISQLPFDPVSGNSYSKITCSKEIDCQSNFTCNPKSKTCIPKNPYLEFRDGKCVYGNFALMKWCKFPNQRRLKGEVGVTDVPPFKYDPTTGKCEITKDYCDWMGISYKIDHNGEPTCYSQTGQQIGEFLLGKTIFRGLKRGEGTPITKDFAGKNVSLYLSDGKLSFNTQEVKRAFPDLVTNDGYIRFKQSDLEDPAKKRLFFTLRHSKWISPSFIKTVGKHM